MFTAIYIHFVRRSVTQARKTAWCLCQQLLNNKRSTYDIFLKTLFYISEGIGWKIYCEYWFKYVCITVKIKLEINEHFTACFLHSIHLPADLRI